MCAASGAGQSVSEAQVVAAYVASTFIHPQHLPAKLGTKSPLAPLYIKVQPDSIEKGVIQIA